jgi:hypothetical protein
MKTYSKPFGISSAIFRTWKHLMIEVQITPKMLQASIESSKKLGILNNSIRSGNGNLAGFLGEECVLNAISGSLKSNTYDYDILIGDKRFEVKTKDRTVAPRPEYECSIPNYNTKQLADYYIFVSLLRKNNDYLKGYVLGYMSKDEYFKKATLLKKGDIDKSNNFTVKADCWNLKINELHQIKGNK